MPFAVPFPLNRRSAVAIRPSAIGTACATLITAVSGRYSLLLIPEELAAYARAAAAALLVSGIPFPVGAAKPMLRGFTAGRLVTDGPFGVGRHPIYGPWIVFNLPAVELLAGSWLGLTSSAFEDVLLRIMARAEENDLRDKFGPPYAAYRKRTPFVLPLGSLRKSTDRPTSEAASE